MARRRPAAPLSSLASSSIISYFSASPRPRPPETTTAASSSFGPVVSSTWRCSTLAPLVAPVSGTSMVTTSAAPPPPSSAANVLGRTSTSHGFSPVKVALTIVEPPNTWWLTTGLSPSTSMPLTLVSTVRSSLADRRPAVSRPS